MWRNGVVFCINNCINYCILCLTLSAGHQKPYLICHQYTPNPLGKPTTSSKGIRLSLKRLFIFLMHQINTHLHIVSSLGCCMYALFHRSGRNFSVNLGIWIKVATYSLKICCIVINILCKICLFVSEINSKQSAILVHDERTDARQCSIL